MSKKTVDGFGTVDLPGTGPWRVVKNSGSFDIVDADNRVVTPDVNGNPNVVFAKQSDAAAIVAAFNEDHGDLFEGADV